jgi:hypothetical protein
MVEDVVTAAAWAGPAKKNVILVAKANQVDETGTTKRYLELSEEDANHVTFLGPSGFRKTTAMKAWLQEIWLKTTWGREKEKPLIVIFEAKHDRAKAQKVKQVFYQLLREKGESWLIERLGSEHYRSFKLYMQLLSAPGLAGQVGRIIVMLQTN